jgi:hypothetical protein
MVALAAAEVPIAALADMRHFAIRPMSRKIWYASIEGITNESVWTSVTTGLDLDDANLQNLNMKKFILEGGEMQSPTSSRVIPVDHAGRVDSLDRTPFARYLLDITMRIDVSEGAVVGLEGQWGSGKTWVFNQLIRLANELSDESKPIIVEFNPWMLSGSVSMVEALLVQIAAQTSGPSKDRLGEAADLATHVLTYASALGVLTHAAPAVDLLFPGAGHIVALAGAAGERIGRAKGPLTKFFDAIKKKPEAVSLPAKKSAVTGALSKYSGRIIVLIDDLDRLPPPEFAAIVQAVKAVANFPKVLYLVAYDPDIAEVAIKQALNVSDGRRFLEKVIQLALPIPPVPASRIKQTFKERLSDCIARHSAELAVEETSDLTLALPIAAAVLETPRDLVRLETRLSVALPVLRSQINVADLLVAEALALRLPKFIEWQDHNPGVLTKVNVMSVEESLYERGIIHSGQWLTGSDKAKKHEEQTAEWTALLAGTPRQVESAKRAASFLFDEATHWSDSKRTEYRRIQDFNFWYRWRCFTNHHEPWETDRVGAFLREPALLESEGITEDSAQLSNFFYLVVRTGTNSFDQANSAELAKVLIAAESEFGRDAFNIGLGESGILAALLIALRLDQSQRLETCRLVVATGGLTLSNLLITRLEREAGTVANNFSESKRITLSEDEIAKLKSAWNERAWQALNDLTNASADGLSPYIIALYMGFWNVPVDQLRQSLATRLQNPKAGLRDVFSNFEGEHAELKLQWQILPDIGFLRTLLQFSPNLSSTYPALTKAIIDGPPLDAATESSAS